MRRKLLKSGVISKPTEQPAFRTDIAGKIFVTLYCPDNNNNKIIC